MLIIYHLFLILEKEYHVNQVWFNPPLGSKYNSSDKDEYKINNIVKNAIFVKIWIYTPEPIN